MPAVRAGLVAFAVVAGLGAANGGFFPDAWGPAVVLLAWGAAVLLVLGAPPPAARGRLVLALVCALAGWTALGAAWSDSATQSLLEAERALVEIAAVLTLLLARDRDWTLPGVVAAAALLSAWDLAGGDPVGYANGSGALAAIAIPLALRERVTWPALVVLVPELALSGSRGAWLALALAGLVAAVRRPSLLVAAVAVAVALAWAGDARRGEYFRVAVDEARAAPLAGTGAGTWNEWWLRKRPSAHDAQDAHSVYLETLGEQGAVGLALLVALLAVPLAARPRDRLALAAYGTFVVHAGVDWDRELPAVWLAGLAVGTALLPAAPQVTLCYKRRAAGVVAAVALGALGVLSGLAQISNARAGDAARAGDFTRAETLARRAHRIEPWSALPLRTLGEAQLAAGDRAAAAATFRRALDRDPRSARLWRDLADATGSRRAAETAHRLDPLGG